MKQKSGSSGGIGFSTLLTLMFIFLKLTGQIDWSWLWVLSPIWIEIILLVVLTVVVWFKENH